MAAITTTALTQAAGQSGRSFGPASGRKRGLRGAMFGLPYIGPVLSGGRPGVQTIKHYSDSAGVLAGGAAGSSGYREKDAYSSIGGEIEDVGLSAGEGADVVAVSRPTGRTAFIGDGVPGGSFVSDKGAGGSQEGAVIDADGRATSTGVDRFGRTKGVANAGAGLGTYDYTNFDGRATLSGDGGRSLGSAGRGSMETDGETVSQKHGRPTVDGTTASSGTVAIIDGTAQELDIDIDDADQTGGANGRVGCEVAVFKRDADDTDEDGAIVGFFKAIGAGSDTIKTGALTGLEATSYAVYVRWVYLVPSGGTTVHAVGPWSARFVRSIA